MATYDRLPRESSKAYAAFQAYLDLGPTRTLEKLSVNCPQTVRGLQYLYQRWQWKERAMAYDTHMAEVAQAAKEAEIQAVVQAGYANMHIRVRELNEVAEMLRERIADPEQHYVDTKIGDQFNKDLFSEWRDMLADIAAELGHRVKNQNIAITELPKKILRQDDVDAV